MYLDQVPMNKTNIRNLLQKHLSEEIGNDDDYDDPIVEIIDTPERIMITTETGCVFHVTITKIH